MVTQKAPRPVLPQVHVEVPANTSGKVRDVLANGHRRGVIQRAALKDVARAEQLARPEGVYVRAKTGDGPWRWWHDEQEGCVRVIVSVKPTAAAKGKPIEA